MTAQRLVRPETAFSLSGRRKRPRIEEGAHLKFIRTLPCLVTGRRDGVEAAHIRYGDPSYGKRETGIAEKPDDCWTVPLQRDQHRDQHLNNEREWWAAIGIDPLKVAIALHHLSGDEDAAELILRTARENRMRTSADHSE